MFAGLSPHWTTARGLNLIYWFSVSFEGMMVLGGGYQPDERPANHVRREFTYTKVFSVKRTSYVNLQRATIFFPTTKFTKSF